MGKIKGNWVVFQYQDIWIAEMLDIYGDVAAVLRFESEQEATRFVLESL